MELLVIGPHRPGPEPPSPAPGPAPQDPPEAVHVRAEGELDLWTGPELADRVVRAATAGTGVVLDLRDVTFADCSTVALVTQIARRAEAEGWTLRILPGSPAAQRVFALTGTLETLPFAATDEGATR